jgi:GT2 family glycosyltransferase
VGGGYGADRLPYDHPVRTVQCGAYRRAALLAIGGFDPVMAYGEDEELNWRLRQRGLEVILCPALRQHYRPRASLMGLWRQYWNYGRGRMRVLRKHPDFLAPRHLAPSALVLALVGLAAAGAILPAAHAALALVAVTWGAVLIGAACTARGARLRERLLLPCAVGGMHLAYGAGLLRQAVTGMRSAAARSGPDTLSTASHPCPRDSREAVALPSLSVVICTKDRPEPLWCCLESLATQTHRARELIVVDASLVPSVDAVDAFARQSPECQVQHLRAAPGLPRQRNVGVRAASCEVIVFLDDDVVLEPGYLAGIARVYAENGAGDIGGVGGAQVPDPTPQEPWLRRAAGRLFLLNGYGRGVVKRSGRVEYALSPARSLEVDFLSGCNMSFRRVVFDTFAFDERLAGYALGEDLQFSYRVSRRWRLVVTPAARLDHRHAGGGRPAGGDLRAMAAFNKYLFFRECVARRPVDWLVYAWAGVGDALLRLRAPRARGLRGVLRGYRLVWRHLTCGELPASYVVAATAGRARDAVASSATMVSGAGGR